jgi:hypothetical protein
LTLNYGAIGLYCAIIRGVSGVFYPSTPPDHVISAMSLLRHEARSQVLVVPLLRSNGTVEPLEAKSAVFSCFLETEDGEPDKVGEAEF